LSLATGKPIRAKDVFRDGGISSLAKKLWARFQRRVRERKVELGKGRDDLKAFDEAIASHSLARAKRALDVMTVTPEGVSFEYSVYFPHAVEAWAPAPWYFFSWKELAPFLRDDGPFPPRVH
jgi:hypothetical protein